MLRIVGVLALLAALLPAPASATDFNLGFNYEGPADRAWQMWDDGKFDAKLIDADFGRAAGGGAKTMRIFVQAPLVVNIAAGKWDKLDAVVGLAEQHGLALIVSLHDYGERDLARVSATAGKIAERYRGRPGIQALDLKNEPRFGDLALARYASPPPLQQRVLIDAFGERLPRDQVGDYRASDDGTKTVPSYLSDDEAWIYVNNLRLYREMLAEASAWLGKAPRGSTTLSYLDDPAGQKWQPLVGALNATLQAWLAPQMAAIRAADPDRQITVDHVDTVLAKLPANDVLDVETLHRYPAAGAAAVRAVLSLASTIQQAHPGKPFVLGEFGYATDSVDPPRAALNETAIFLGLLAQGARGADKWMLNDMPSGYNMRERTLGAFQLDGSPKPVVPAMSALRAYLTASGSPPGEFTIQDDPEVGLRYAYKATDALLLGGRQVDGGGASFTSDGPAELFVTWTDPGSMRVWASGPLQASIDISIAGGSGESKLARVDGSAEKPQALNSRDGTRATMSLQPGWYVLHFASAAPRAADSAIDNGHFFAETGGYSVSNADGMPFWDAFRAQGGVDVLGYPVTRRFQLDGFTVQAFQKAVLQWRPDLGGRFAYLNTFDVLHDRGKDDWLDVARQTPRPQDTAADKGLAWDAVVARHLAMLDGVPAPLKQRFLSDPDWLDHYGLPVSTGDYSTSIVVRAQRATLQYWKVDVPWAAKGSVSVANGGDLAKEAGLFPAQATTPERAPG